MFNLAWLLKSYIENHGIRSGIRSLNTFRRVWDFSSIFFKAQSEYLTYLWSIYIINFNAIRTHRTGVFRIAALGGSIECIMFVAIKKDMWSWKNAPPKEFHKGEETAQRWTLELTNCWKIRLATWHNLTDSYRSRLNRNRIYQYSKSHGCCVKLISPSYINAFFPTQC